MTSLTKEASNSKTKTTNAATVASGSTTVANINPAAQADNILANKHSAKGSTRSFAATAKPSKPLDYIGDFTGTNPVKVGGNPEVVEAAPSLEETISSLPKFLREAINKEPDDYEAEYVKRCFTKGTRLVETTTPRGEVGLNAKRIICKGKRCCFCYPFLEKPRYEAKLKSVPLDQDAQFITYTHDQSYLRQLGISPRMSQVIHGKMVGHVRDRMQEYLWDEEYRRVEGFLAYTVALCVLGAGRSGLRVLLPLLCFFWTYYLSRTHHWQYSAVMETHRRGWAHGHGLNRDTAPLNYFWRIGAYRLKPDGKPRGKTLNIGNGGFWRTAAKYFINRAHPDNIKKDDLFEKTGRKVPEKYATDYWDYTKAYRLIAQYADRCGVPEIKAETLSLLKRRRRDHKYNLKQGKGNQFVEYAALVNLVEGDVSIDGCLCHPRSRYFADRDKHNIMDEFRALLVGELAQVFGRKVGLGMILVQPVFDVEAARKYLPKEMSKESQKNAARPKDAQITYSTHNMFREYQEAFDPNTYRQAHLKGRPLPEIVKALKAQGAALGEPEYVRRFGMKVSGDEFGMLRDPGADTEAEGGFEILFGQPYVPPEDSVLTIDRIGRWAPIMFRNLRWDKETSKYQLGGDDVPRVLLTDDGVEVYSFTWEGEVVHRTHIGWGSIDGEASPGCAKVTELNLSFGPRPWTEKQVNMPTLVGDLADIILTITTGDFTELVGKVHFLAWHDDRLLEFDGCTPTRIWDAVLNIWRKIGREDLNGCWFTELFPGRIVHKTPKPIQPVLDYFDDGWGDRSPF